MKNNFELQNLKNFQDEALTDLLFTEKDTLSRVVIDEFVRRGERMVELLRLDFRKSCGNFWQNWTVYYRAVKSYSVR